jgi:CRISPR-associated endonuclease Csn1
MKRIWGFDIGTTSIGFAVIEHDEVKQAGRIQRLGVRIFPEGVTEKDREPRNKARRAARLIRRQLRRRRWRRRLLNETLVEMGLLPPYGTPDWFAAMAADPYDLRAKALTGPLNPTDLGRALYHLSKHRGFAARRGAELDPTAQDASAKKEEGVVRENIGHLRAEMAGNTLGAFLSRQEKKRNRHLGRDMVEEEFDRIWSAQAAHHPAVLTPAARERIAGIVFHQRPTFWRLKTLGTCELEPDSPLCLKGSWLGQRYLMFQDVNGLRLAGGNARPLDEAERAKVVAFLESEANITFPRLRKLLALPRDQRFNFEIGGRKNIQGNALEAALAEAIGEGWAGHPNRDRIRAEFPERRRTIDYRAVGCKRIEIRPVGEVETHRARFVDIVQKDWGVSPAQAEALAGISLPPGWLRHSVKAVGVLLPHMEAGLRYDQALDAAYPGRRRPPQEGLARLPSHFRAMPDLRNPTVARALNELRKAVNNLLAVHGRPDIVRVELTRDLKLPRRVRERVMENQREQERRRKEALKELESNGIANPAGRDIEKWLLWQECQRRCPYTGRAIDFDALFRRDEFQVEHIFPRSRSLDNSFGNKTLCESNLNRDKGNRTPCEYFSNDREEWERVQTRAKQLFLPHAEAKARRFLKAEFAEAGSDDFAARQLADTGYIAREAKDFLMRLFPRTQGQADAVEACNGRITAQLRHNWGLDTILNPEGKTRDDHRHHAVDALAVALTTRAFVKRLSDYYAGQRQGLRPSFPSPWPSLRDDMVAATKGILVSHRASRKLAGRLHEQMALGATNETKEKGGVRLQRFVRRKPIRELSEGEVDAIRDPAIQGIVKRRIAEAGDVKTALGQEIRLLSRNGTPGRIVRKVRIWIDRQMKVMAALRPGRRTYAELGQNTNHHMAIYRNDRGAVHETVTRLEAIRRCRRGEPVVKPQLEDGSALVMSLSANDTFEVSKTNGIKERFVVRKVNEKGRVFYKPLSMATEPKPEVSFAPSRFLQDDIRKVKIDPIGRVRPAND